MLLRAPKSCQDGPSGAQEPSKTGPRGAKTPPGRPQELPRCLQDRPKGAQDASKTAQEAPKTAPRALKRLPTLPREPPRACRIAQKPPSWLQDGPKSAFKCIQEDPKSLYKMQLAAQTAVQLLSRKQNLSIRPFHNASYH